MQRTCSTPECGKKHVAKGLCSTCYNRQNYTAEQRHAKTAMPCAQCGNACTKDKGREKRYEHLFCGYPCREAWNLANGHPLKGRPWTDERLERLRASMNGPRVVALRKIRTAARGTSGTTWVAGACRRCAKPFVSALIGSDLGRYCSNRCKRQQKATRRRARHRGALHEPYSRIEIFERDGYRCHLCRKLTLRNAVVPHPKAPVIDHLIPLGPGADAAHNVATAHFLCNSRRRDVGPAQLMLFG